MPLRKCLTFLLAALTALYPVAIYIGEGVFNTRGVLCALLGLALLRVAVSRECHWLSWMPAVFALCGIVLLPPDARTLKLYPVLVNAAMMLMFGWSLRYPPTIVERLARLQTPDLPPHAVRYTRRVTQIWCGFFLCNGLIALFTVYWASDNVWMLYTGPISYGLMGTLMAGEWLMRAKVKARFHDASSVAKDAIQ